MIKYSIPILLALFVSSIGCKATRKVQSDVIKKPKSAKFLTKKMLQNQLSADWLAAKARITVREGRGVQKFTANLRWRKDSVLWMNFKKVSVEGARVLITPDSIFVIDRLNKQYAKKSFEFAQKEFHLPTGFQGLQNLLLGNPIFFTKELSAGIDEDKFYLKGKTDRFVNEYWLTADSFLLDKMLVEDYRNQRLVEMYLGDYQTFSDGRKFSYFRLLNLSSRELGEVSIKIELSKVEIDEPKTIRFSIPEHYEEME